MSRPSQQRKKEDMQMVAVMLNGTGSKEYEPSFNPHPVGTLRHERFERYYRREQAKWVREDAHFRSVYEMYGMD